MTPLHQAFSNYDVALVVERQPSKNKNVGADRYTQLVASSSCNDLCFLQKGKSKANKSTDIFALIKKKDVMGLDDYLLSCTADDVNRQLPKSLNTPLHEALLDRAEECATSLLKVDIRRYARANQSYFQYDGINIDLRNASDNTPLHYFCEKWQSPSYAELFKIFMKKSMLTATIIYQSDS